MNLLTYTRYLKQKIKFYENLVTKLNTYTDNPFIHHNHKSTTIVWVEDCERDIDEK